MCAADLNLLGDNVNTMKETEALMDSVKEVGLRGDTEKTKQMLSRHQHVEQNKS